MTYVTHTSNFPEEFKILDQVSTSEMIMSLTDEEVEILFADLLDQTVTKLLRERRFENGQPGVYTY